MRTHGQQRRKNARATGGRAARGKKTKVWSLGSRVQCGHSPTFVDHPNRSAVALLVSSYASPTQVRDSRFVDLGTGALSTGAHALHAFSGIAFRYIPEYSPLAYAAVQAILRGKLFPFLSFP